MENKIKARREAFNSALSPRAQAQTVGNTIGDRRQIQKARAVETRPAVARPLDKYNKDKNTGKNTELFKSSASYRTGSHSTIAAYKSAILGRVENGTMPKRSFGIERLFSKGPSPATAANEVKRPSDTAILNFLDKVITNPELQSANRIRRAAQGDGRALHHMGSPVRPSKA